MPSDAAELTALRQRIAHLEAQNATLQWSISAGRATQLPPPAAASAATAAAAVAALQQRVSYLQAQNATLRVDTVEAQAAAAAAAHAAMPMLERAADTDVSAAVAPDQQAAAAASPAMTALLAASAAAAAVPLPPQHVRWEEQRRLQRQVDTLKHRLQVSNCRGQLTDHHRDYGWPLHRAHRARLPIWQCI